MPHHASPTMGPRTGTLTKSWEVWARLCVGVWVVLFGWCFPVGGSAAAIPSDLTTESYIYTGPTTAVPTAPPPPKDFEVTYKEAYASFVNLTISYNATLNLTKIHVNYEDPVDLGHKSIWLFIGANAIDPFSLYEANEGRLGFKFKLAGLYRRQRYAILFLGCQGKEKVVEFRVNFLTGDNDGEDNVYNLTGIFLVLGISTIIMAVVLFCVGYEKLIHNKSEECWSYIFCRRKKRKIQKASISPEPLMVNDGRGFDDDDSTDSNHRY